jgi:phospholipid-binding lipoprotein MlaA
MARGTRLRRHATALALCVALASCATLPSTGAWDDGDPLEPVNRAVFDFNMKVDALVIDPVARAYRDVFPAFVRDRLRGFLDNLAEPRIFVNDLLQGRGDAAGKTFARFFINTTAGLVGFFDQATPAGYIRQSGDFGQTLYAWGVVDGPYLVLPFFGPSNARDAFGLGVDLYTTPPTPLLGGSNARGVEWGLTIVDGIDQRARNIEVIDEMKKGALDVYTHFRSLWRQYRRARLREARGQAEEPEELLDPEAGPMQ